MSLWRRGFIMLSLSLPDRIFRRWRRHVWHLQPIERFWGKCWCGAVPFVSQPTRMLAWILVLKMSNARTCCLILLLGWHEKSCKSVKWFQYLQYNVSVSSSFSTRETPTCLKMMTRGASMKIYLTSEQWYPGWVHMTLNQYRHVFCVLWELFAWDALVCLFFPKVSQLQQESCCLSW